MRVSACALGRFWIFVAFQLGVSLSGDVLAAPTLVFPQFVSGQQTTTRIIVRNNANVIDRGEIRFNDPDGNPIGVSVGGVVQSVIDYSILRYGTLDIMTDGTGPLQSGSIVVLSDRGDNSMLEGSIVFQIGGFRTSVPNAVARNTNQIYVSRTSDENTGFAAFNPSETETVPLYVNLVDDAGAEQALAQLALGPQARVAVFVDDGLLFKSFFDSLSGLQGADASFQGTMNISADLQRVAVVGLIQDLNDLSLVATSTSFTGLFRVPEPASGAALCGCSAFFTPSTPGEVLVRYGLHGPDAGNYDPGNVLRFEWLEDGAPISPLSFGVNNAPVGACGSGILFALGLNNFPKANEIRLTLAQVGGVNPIYCIARFRD